MTETSDKLIAICAFLTLLILSTLYLAHNQGESGSEGFKMADTVFVCDTLWRDTTIIKEKLVPKIVKVVKIDTLYDSNGNEIELTKENKVYVDTAMSYVGDTVVVTNYISGYEPTLDSMKVQLSKREITKTEYITEYVTPKRTFKDHFSFGVGVGYGYGLNNKQFEPFIGVSLIYK